MKPFLSFCYLLISISMSTACAEDWMTWSSTYTHDSRGNRVDQYAQAVDPIGPDRSQVQRSIYRNYRSTLQAGQSADNYHVVEQVGQPIVPYEQWRFPFRPYGVPYDAWGPQTPLSMFNGFPGGYSPYVPRFGQGPATGTGTGGMGGTGMGTGYPWGGGSGGPAWPGNYYQPSPYGYNAPNGGNPFGFPLQPNYANQPWFDGNYPDAPPLDTRTDRQFFWAPPR